jgi:uncharacterized protein (TIGR03435 family)
MMRAIHGTCLILLALCAAYAQTGDGSPTFDSASIKASPPRAPGRASMMRLAGGPGTQTPGRVNWENISLTNLILLAYEVKAYQVSSPEWMNGTSFDLLATVAKDATKEQFHLMLQSLLAERFKLKLHHERKESDVYSLVVGKNGPKMKESPEEPPPPGKMQKDEDGFSVFPGMRGIYTASIAGRERMRASQENMAQFVMTLSGQLGRPVTDATGLKGKYDFIVTYAPAGAAATPEADADPDIIGAMQQIGLKLERKKGMIDTLVIDHLEKIPTEN